MRHRPLLVWAAAFAAGIGVEAQWHPPLALVLGLAAFALSLLALGRRPSLFVAGLLGLGLAVGALRLAAFGQISPADVSRWADRPAPVLVTGTVVSDPEIKRGGRLTFFLKAEQISARRQTFPVVGDVSVALGPDAARVASLDYGDRVRLDGTLETPPDATNPGAFSWRAYLARRAVYCQLRVKRAGAVERLGGTRMNPYARLAWAVRRRVLEAVKASLTPTEAAVLSGILIGRRTELSPELTADFVHTGTVHILASAGLHVGIVAFWLQWLARRLTLPRKWGALGTVAFLWLYALMAGGRPSVTRAVAMATVYFGAVLFEREPDAPTAVGAASLVILMAQPTALLEPGFQMSFLTILTLAVCLPVWDTFWRPRIEGRIAWKPAQKAALWVAEMAGLSLIAQLGAAPVVAQDYNEVSLVGWLANALVVPALFALIPLSFLGTALWGLWHAGGAFLLAGAGWGVERIVGVVRTLGELPWGYRAIPSPPLPLLLAFYGAVWWVGTRQPGRTPPRTISPPSPPSGPASAEAERVGAGKAVGGKDL